MSDYPEVWNFEEAGKEVLAGNLVKIDKVLAKKYGTDLMVEKFVATIRTADDVEHAVWLDSAVLLRIFKDEAAGRRAEGRQFDTDEAVEIEYLGKRQGATYRYKDFNVTFANPAAASSDAFNALAGADDPAPAIEPVSIEVEDEPVKEAAVAAEPSSQSDEIPF